MVYKLVARQGSDGEWVSVAKTSAAKLSVGGRKFPVRTLTPAGIATSEAIHVGTQPPAGTGRPLLVQLIDNGVPDDRFRGAAGTFLAREHREAAIAELPQEAFRLARGEPVIPTIFS
jgi:nicotinate phosphoribosyltransferase